jgi:hypothetical protein
MDLFNSLGSFEAISLRLEYPSIPYDPKIHPNLIIAGVPKAGTTSVFAWLADHPDGAGSIVKETNYFSGKQDPQINKDTNFIEHGLDRYSELFPNVNAEKLVLESTPAYVYDQVAIQGIAQLPSAPKVMFILRNPADRVLSIFFYLKTHWQACPEDMTFTQFVAHARNGTWKFEPHWQLRDAFVHCEYEHHLDNWRAAIGNTRIKVFIFEEMIKNKVEFMKYVSSWVGIDPSFYDSYDFYSENESYQVRSWAFQKVNLFIRARMPQGLIHRNLRSLYKKMNTVGGKAKLSDEDQKTYNDIDNEFRPIYERLREKYTLEPQLRKAS